MKFPCDARLISNEAADALKIDSGNFIHSNDSSDAIRFDNVLDRISITVIRIESGGREIQPRFSEA